MPQPVAIGHLDADCFYVSAERVRNRFLAGKPVAVLGNQGACVIAKSYEAKACGVKTGMPIWDARKLCPQAVYVKRDFRWYEILSRKMLDTLREFSATIEYYSIDEFFFRITPFRGLSLQQTAEALRDRIFWLTRLPVTVGLARTRTLAKLVSDTAKPFGALALLDREAEQRLLQKHPVTEISGIGGRRALRLAPYGIVTCLDLARADRRLVRDVLTRTGEALWYELNGDPVTPILTDRPHHKALARGGSLGGATVDRSRVYGWLVRNLERLIEELEFHAVSVGALSVSIQHQDGLEGDGRVKLSSPTNRFDLLLEAAQACFKKAYFPSAAATYMHVVATELRWPGSVQLGLFDPPQDRARTIAAVKHEVNTRVRRFALRSGATLPLADIYRDEAQSYDICDVRGKICF